jgi:hypothetical protein
MKLYELNKLINQKWVKRKPKAGEIIRYNAGVYELGPKTDKIKYRYCKVIAINDIGFGESAFGNFKDTLKEAEDSPIEHPRGSWEVERVEVLCN